MPSQSATHLFEFIIIIIIIDDICFILSLHFGTKDRKCLSSPSYHLISALDPSTAERKDSAVSSVIAHWVISQPASVEGHSTLPACFDYPQTFASQDDPTCSRAQDFLKKAYDNHRQCTRKRREEERKKGRKEREEERTRKRGREDKEERKRKQDIYIYKIKERKWK